MPMTIPPTFPTLLPDDFATAVIDRTNIAKAEPNKMPLNNSLADNLPANLQMPTISSMASDSLTAIPITPSISFAYSDIPPRAAMNIIRPIAMAPRLFNPRLAASGSISPIILTTTAIIRSAIPICNNAAFRPLRSNSFVAALNDKLAEPS